jgi:hypothetical protein
VIAGKVIVGYCYAQTTTTPQWQRSYSMVLLRDATKTRRIIGEFAHEVSGPHLPTAKCDIVRQFLAHPDKPDWLWMVDTDATFAPDTLDRLLASADPVTRPIVGALAFGVRPAKDAKGHDIRNGVGATPLELFPTIYVYGENGVGMIVDYPQNELVQCHATGGHCILLHRDMLADPRWLADEHPQPWFRMAHRGAGEVSEDQFFCMKAGSLGYPVYVDTSIKTGHVKTFIADEDLYLAQRS